MSKTNNDGYGSFFDFKGGGVLFFNQSVGLELFLNYILSNSKSSISNSNTNSLSIGIGFQIHLEKK
ncbi:hypothetical protein [Hanstruepera marina]|uniref:hypothetical protein n=1 Tax=Hanstruepera marina TaxID=2873265 RepID=UPI001CA79886|nr:hypothetical protein [Hanstruepera marina]